ncbi:hypothetical protein HMPREF9545_04179 [Escherichia coli MS 16-3]|nr:hypothetical protein HMPREF9545_04179 [Escherichia coli MS 16-3]
MPACFYGVMLSLTCTRTSIPASLQAYSHYATSSGSPSLPTSPPSLFYNCRQVLPSRRTTKSPRQA